MDQLPLKKSSKGSEIETRPIYIEEWLDSLSYIDFKKTSALLNEALIATNKADIKSSTRLELIELYNRPYQYYVASQINAGAQHTLQTIDVMGSQVSQMKQIAVSLSYSCKLAFDSSLKKKTLWKQSKPPIEAMLMSMNYLSHALIFSFLEYAPIPKNVWQQLNFIYEFAESMECHKKIYSIPGENNKNISTTIDHTYKRIMMASLVDPHHLPFGAIWEIYEQLNTWAEYTQIHPMQSLSNSSGYFVFDLKTDNKAIAYAKFNHENITNNTRLLDSTPLENLIQKQIDLIQMGQPIDKTIVLSPFYAKSLLAHMLKAWGLPPKRYFPRKPKSGKLKIVSGVNAIYYFLNNETAFQSIAPPVETESDEIDITENISDDSNVTLSGAHYVPEEWRIVDEGSGGYAVIRDQKPRKVMRVGDLVGVNQNEDSWSIGVTRWLMVSKTVHKIGLQIVADTAKPVALRACNGSKTDREFKPAFLVSHNSNPNELSIIAEKGLYIADRELEINIKDKKEIISATTLIESSMSYDVFSYKT
jgi:cyclic-di-GMP-binding protein